MKLAPIGAAALLTALAVSCAELPVPAGYVPLEDPRPPLRVDAVASSGNRYQVREHENPDGATLEFWVDAIERELVHARGYELLSRDELRTEAGGRGMELQFSSRHQLETYRYLLAVFVDGDCVLVCEAGGSEEALVADLEAVRAAVRQLDVREGS